MIITKNFKDALAAELKTAKKLWVASAMISSSGWHFIQAHLPTEFVEQHYLIGTDLATHPKVFEILLANLHINARVFRSGYTYHPKVYLILNRDGQFRAFVGSSNTTSWGLEKNVEVNFRIDDRAECQKLLDWFYELYGKGYLITDSFLAEYRSRFKRAVYKKKEIQADEQVINEDLAKDEGQFFTQNEHQIFEEKYHKMQSADLRRIRENVSEKFKLLHEWIYPLFKSSGLVDLHAHHHGPSIVSRHYFNTFSGNYVNAIWLHYGKSLGQLQQYKSKHELAFINNIRLQVILRENFVGFWLMLGRPNASIKDREKFRSNLSSPEVMQEIFQAIKNLGKGYWMSGTGDLSKIENLAQLARTFEKERSDDYFIIGKDVPMQDPRLSASEIAQTTIAAFQKLYPLYMLFKHV